MNSYLKLVRMNPTDYREIVSLIQGPTAVDRAGMTFEQWIDATFRLFESNREAEGRPVVFSEIPLLDPSDEGEWLSDFTHWNVLSEFALQMGAL